MLHRDKLFHLQADQPWKSGLGTAGALLCPSLLENVTPAAAPAHHHQPVLFTTAVAVQREVLFAVQRHHQGLPAIVKSSHAPKTSDPWGFAAAGTPVSISHLSGRVALAISAGVTKRHTVDLQVFTQDLRLWHTEGGMPARGLLRQLWRQVSWQQCTFHNLVCSAS